MVRTGWEAHLHPLPQRGPEPTDTTGVLFVLGGVLLLAGGALLLLRTATASRGRRARPA